MSVSVAQYIAEYNDKFVKSPHGILGQCVSVPSEFAVLSGWPELFGPGDGTALEIWNNGVQGYQKIKNVPGPTGNAPTPGNFVFFGAAYGGGAGHTGLVVSANLNEVTLFEQNDPDGSSAHQKVYSYDDVEGWFHWPQPTPNGTAEAIRNTNVRASASTSSALAGSKELLAGQTFQYQNIVNGQIVDENGVTSGLWYESTEGHYVWSGNVKAL